MSRRDAIRLSRQMVGLQAEVIRFPSRPQWDRYGVEYSACYTEPSENSLLTQRFRIWDIRSQEPSLVIAPQPLKTLDKKGGEENE